MQSLYIHAHGSAGVCVLVRRQDLTKVAEKLSAQHRLSLDCETTGLRPYQGDRPFSIGIATEDEVFYFNLKSYEGIAEDCVLDPATLKLHLDPVFSNPHLTWFGHNFKFDLAHLAAIGIELAGQLHDTEVGARLEYNDHLNYSLDACAERIGLKKDDAVKEYVKKHKLWEWETFQGEKLNDKRLYFDRVPLELIASYTEQDARITYQLGRHQEAELIKLAACVPEGKLSILNVHANEKQLTKTCFGMERTGVRIDAAYCDRALRAEQAEYRRAAADFERLTGCPFVDSGKSLQRAFDRVGARYGRTEKGNPSFTSEVLESLSSEPGALVLRYREHYKRAHTYYQNFLRFADADGAIHANVRQSGTATGRFSYSEPNLQNLHKEEGEELAAEYVVRRAFIPREGYVFACFDMDQVEYRMMLDYAGELALIEKVKSGLDVHEATAQMMGVTRKEAKTINFMLLYGGGAQKLADALGITLEQAKDLRAKYFQTLPAVQGFIRSVCRAAELRGWIRNWAGRVYQFPNPEFSYKAPNYLIQGGCADQMKIAMNRIADRLRGTKSRMLLQIHDEVVVELNESEMHLIPEIKAILEGVYPYRYLPLTCGVELARKTLADKQEYVLLEA
jgi:DNA polymerase-1